jgi:hypothetical protein
MALSVSLHSFDFDKKIITVEATIPVLNLVGDYEGEGKVLGAPISGKGPWNSTSCKYSFHKYLLLFIVQRERMFKASDNYETKREITTCQTERTNIIFL